MIIMDNFLPDNVWREFCKKKHWEEPHTSFFRYDTQPSSFFNQVSLQIWKWYTKKYNPSGVVGIETWTNRTYNEDSIPLPWHCDRDEQHYRETGENLHPICGIVLYGHETLPEGAYLEIERKHGNEFIEPVPNRLILFDPSIHHRVPPMHGGYRYTMASNLWNRELKPWRGEWTS